jgi:hypothetical protein
VPKKEVSIFILTKQKKQVMKWFSLFITVFFWAYTVFFFSIMGENNNALVMFCIMTFASLVVSGITVQNFKKDKA